MAVKKGAHRLVERLNRVIEALKVDNQIERLLDGAMAGVACG
jgi:hypothetical protein